MQFILVESGSVGNIKILGIIGITHLDMMRKDERFGTYTYTHTSQVAEEGSLLLIL